MKFTTLFFILISLVDGLTIPQQQDTGRPTLKPRGETLAITGVSGAVHPRLEVRQMFYTKPNQWTLFVLALRAFQAQSQDSKTSYYQIAGIHGVPQMSWDGVGQCSECSGADGYCTHDSILFLAWHRAYLALFEQELMKVVHTVADEYPEKGGVRAAMQGAAAEMRLPYWDWAAHPPADHPTFPIIVSQKYVTVAAPAGPETIVNPLFRHDFADPSDLKYSPFIDWNVTLRYPNSDAATASSKEDSATAAFNNIRASLQDQVYQLFSTCSQYTEVGDSMASSSKCSNSFENIHNTVHNTIGGPMQNGVTGGHMTYLPLSAFDPMFWLHHANVDRLFAMWQTIYPDSYGGSQVAPQATWTIAPGSTQNANSPLTPFHKDTTGDFYTTNSVRNWEGLYYTYPEFADSDGSKKAIQSYVNKLYGPSATATAGSVKRTSIPTPQPLTPASQDPTPLVAQNGSVFQYVANIQTSRYALNGSYAIYLFNGNPASEEPTSWIFDANLIGPMGVLASDSMAHTQHIVAAGSIPLTRTLAELVQSGALPDLSEPVVTPYLAANLHWRVAGPSGSEVDPTTIPYFEVSVFASTATQAGEFDLPMYSGFIGLAGVTQDKPGGATTVTLARQSDDGGGSDGQAVSSAGSERTCAVKYVEA